MAHVRRLLQGLEVLHDASQHVEEGLVARVSLEFGADHLTRRPNVRKHSSKILFVFIPG